MKNSLVQNASNAQGEKPCLKPTGSLSTTFSGYYSCVLFFSFPSLLSVLHTEQWGQFTRVNVMQFQLYIQLIQNKMNNFPSEMSGGEQQRTSIARAIVKNPKILLCDEPTGALDSKTGKKIIKLLQDLNKDKDKIVVVVTHNAAIAEVADRVIKLSDGKIVSDVTQRNPKSVEEIDL